MTFPYYMKILYFYLGYGSVADVICKCLNKVSDQRPSLSDIRYILEIYDAFLLIRPFDHAPDAVPGLIIQKLKKVIQMGLDGFRLNDMQSGLHWMGKNHETEKATSDESLIYCPSPGYDPGVAGILLTINKARDCRFRLEKLTQTINYSKAVLRRALERPEEIGPGIFNGTYGLALVIASLGRTGFLKDDDREIGRIEDLLNRPAIDLGITTGLSGQGLAILLSGRFSGANLIERQLSAIITSIMDMQNDDGSWLVKRDEDQSSGVKLNGFAYGISGIIYFLLTYRVRFNDSEIDSCIDRGLDYLISQRKAVGGEYLWWLNEKNPVIDPWLEYGFSGIALTFIKAFEVYKNPIYRETAVSALLCNPKFISSNYFTIGNGLAGLGEIYLEAYRVFKDRQWKERSDHIAGYLAHCYKNDCGHVYWLEGNASVPVYDLMTGNSGIIYFLIRSVYPDRVNFLLSLN